MNDKILITFFIIFLYVPLAGLVFNFQDGLENTEKRNLAEFPKFNAPYQFTKDFMKYYEDNFGFRYTFIKFASNLKIKLFKTYPRNIDAKVLRGKEGWLFYKLGNETEDFEGRVPFSKKTINQIKQNLIKRKEALSGVKFYVLVPPDKTVIYSEYLPNTVFQKQNLANSRIMSLIQSGAEIIYPKNQLIQNKNKDLLYFKTDTHWTYLGAYFGYVEFMKHLGFVPLKLNEFERKPYEHKNPDLAQIANIDSKTFEESFIYECKNKPPKSALKLLIFGDSFYEYLEPYLKCSFESVKFIKSDKILKEEVKNFAPDIVLLEIVQRNVRRLGLEDK